MNKSNIIKVVIIFSCILLGLTGCEKWIEGQELEIELERQKPVLTLMGFLESGKNSVHIHIGQSQNTNAVVNPSIVADVSTTLYKNGAKIYEWDSTEIIDTLSATYDFISQETLYVTSSAISYNTVLEEMISGDGDEYKIEVEASRFDPIHATTLSPKKANVVSTQLVKIDAANDSEYDIEHTIKFVIDDPANEENYYLIDGKVEYTHDGEIYTRQYLFDNYDPDFFDFRTGGLTFKDDSFDGKERSFEFTKGYYEDDLLPTKYRMRVITLSKDYFAFYESIDRAESANYNPLAEPVSHSSNIEGGNGLFTIFNPTTFILE